MPSGTCAGTGSGCHNSTDLAQLHAVGQSGGAPAYQGCTNADANDPTACHSVIDSRPVAFDPAASCGEGTTGCHAEKNATNHGYDAATHTAAPGTGVVGLFSSHEFVGAVSVGVECVECHNTDLGLTHVRICSTCHPAPRSSFASWNGTCSQAQCHPTYHGDTIAAHDAAASGNCGACHDETNFDLIPDPCGSCHALYNPADTVAPVTTSDALTVYTGAARIAFSATDRGKIGVATTFYRIDYGSTVRGDVAVVSTPGQHTIEFWSVDQNGNEETPHKSAAFITTDDSTPPYTTSDAKAAYEGPARITLVAGDASTMGVRGTFYTLNGGPAVEGSSISIAPPVTGTATYSLGFWSEDYSGNVEATNTKTFTVVADVTPPTTTCDAVDGRAYIGGQTFTLTAGDGNGTGVAGTWYKLDAGTWVKATSIPVAAPSTGTASHTLTWYSRDNAGNQETAQARSFTITAGAEPECACGRSASGRLLRLLH